MKRLLLFFLQLALLFNVNGQPDSAYQISIAKAGLYHLQKDYKNAIIYFEKAFEIQKPDALNAYKAAGAYSLDSNSGKAFYYLDLALASGWTEADWLSVDTYFDYLRNVTPGKWEKTEKKAFATGRQYEQTLKLPALRKKINLMTLNDQQLRYKRIQSNNENDIEKIDQQISQSDLKNLAEAKKIIKQYGWPKISWIGKDGQNNLWLIVQHADQDVLFQQTALLAMEKRKSTTGTNLENYAFLYDRVQCNLNYKQLYGTQVAWANNGNASGFRPIINENLVDKRRKELGLTPLRIYALTYRFTYTALTPAQAEKNDSADVAYTRNLIDSATFFYTIKEFQKVYDYYNNASMVLGGMTNADNYQAALIFAKIASINTEQKYKDIALDFLNLLYLRKGLSRDKLEGQPGFITLHKEQRWTNMIKELR